MKKIYQKPEIEYISFVSKEMITDVMNNPEIGGGLDGSGLED